MEMEEKKKTINVRWLVFTNTTVVSASRLRSVFASCSFSLPRHVQNSLAAGEKEKKKKKKSPVLSQLVREAACQALPHHFQLMTPLLAATW